MSLRYNLNISQSLIKFSNNTLNKILKKSLLNKLLYNFAFIYLNKSGTSLKSGAAKRNTL